MDKEICGVETPLFEDSDFKSFYGSRKRTVEFLPRGKKKLPVLTSVRQLPNNRSGCPTTYNADNKRVCAYVTCKYHLLLDVKGNGRVTVNQRKEIENLSAWCALDEAEGGAKSARYIAGIYGVTVGLIQQIIAKAIKKAASSDYT